MIRLKYPITVLIRLEAKKRLISIIEPGITDMNAHSRNAHPDLKTSYEIMQL